MYNDIQLAAKFTGSGGALICLPRTKDKGWLDGVAEATAIEKFREVGFCMIRVEPAHDSNDLLTFDMSFENKGSKNTMIH